MSSPSNSPTTYFIIPTKTPTSPFAMASSSLPPAPPPTPSNHHHSTPIAAPDATTISDFLRQLTPKLSLPPQLRRRHSPAPHTIPLPLKPSLLLESASMHGFFHLSGHDLPWELLASASEEARGVVGGANRMVLGFKDDESDVESDDHDQFFVFDVACLDSVSVPAKLAEAAGMMGRIGVEVVDMLMDASGLQIPFKKEEKKGLRCLMWVSSSPTTGDGEEQCAPWEKKYPYLVCLHYEMKSYTNFKLHLDDDLNEVTVPVQPDSILITIGDIAQVWSNGKFKKVIRKPIPSFSKETNSTEVTMSLLVTLPMDTIVSPLPRIGRASGDNDNDNNDDDDDNNDNKEGEETEKQKYKPFNMDEYASRVYYELLNLKDPLREYLV